MIYDALNHIGQYRGISANLDRAIDAILKTDFSKLESGVYEVDGRDVYFSVQEPELRGFESAHYEAHRRYIDIQFSLTDGEWIRWLAAEEIAKWQPFDEDGDFMLSGEEGEGVPLPLSAGRFVMFWPCDAHMPCLHNGAPGKGRKVVFKVRI